MKKKYSHCDIQSIMIRIGYMGNVEKKNDEKTCTKNVIVILI